MKIKIKLTHKDAKIPTYAHTGEDACVDLYAVEVSGNALSANKIVVDFGVAFEIPAGYCALIFPRSSIHKKDLFLSNCVGVIDSGYRGNVTAVFYKDKLDFQNNKIEVGAQTYKTRMCNNGKVDDVVFWKADEYEKALKNYLTKTDKQKND